MGVNLMEKITSASNAIVKETAKLSQKKYREETGLFLAEGEKAIRGLFETNFEIEKLFVSESLVSNFADLKIENIYVVNDVVLNKVSTTKSPCSAVGVFKQKIYEKKTFENKKRLLLLENIKDAGNLGTILRSSKAFEVEGVLLLGETIDIYNPKVVRAAVGCFDLPIINIDYDDLKRFSYNIYSTALYENSLPLKSVDFKEPLIVAFGSEANGLTKEFLNTVKSTNINIETSNEVESLNLSTAVSICLYEIYT